VSTRIPASRIVCAIDLHLSYIVCVTSGDKVAVIPADFTNLNKHETTNYHMELLSLVILLHVEATLGLCHRRVPLLIRRLFELLFLCFCIVLNIFKFIKLTPTILIRMFRLTFAVFKHDIKHFREILTQVM
jgi:hypothetical protein